MVKRFSMESQSKRMCSIESVLSGAIDDCNAHRLYDEDCFGDILNMLDFPMESLEGDGFAEDWASKFGPIPTEVLREAMPPQIGGGSNFGSYVEPPFKYPELDSKPLKHHLSHNEETNNSYQNVKISQLKQQATTSKLYPSQASFKAPSPNSVLESRTSGSNNRVPVRTRTKRLRPTTNSWLQSSYSVLPTNNQRKTQSQVPITIASHDAGGVKKCVHCEITKTPQWREGPMGPKTLCNACGVRYRSGRLYPEYRPAASPTFVPDLHSNSHRRVIQMRQKTVE